MCFHLGFVFIEAPVRFWKEHCRALKQLTAFLGWYSAWAAALGLDGMSQEKLSELAKCPQILKIVSLNSFQRMGLIWCVCNVSRTWKHMISPWKSCKLCSGCWSVHVHACVECVCTCACVLIFYWFIEPHESFFALNEIVCFFHYRQDKNMLEQPLLLFFFTHLGPDFTSLTSGCELWRCAYITASYLLAKCIKTERKNCCNTACSLCFSAA